MNAASTQNDPLRKQINVVQRMCMDRSLITLFFIFLGSSLFGQVVLERQVIGSSGGSSTTGNLVISHTTGEAVVTTEVSGNLTLTQGFQQSYRSCPTIDSLTFSIAPDTCSKGVGEITGIAVTGGVVPVSYIWKDSTWATVDSSSSMTTPAFPDVDSLYAGDYYLIAVDDNGCADTSGPYNVGEVSGPVVDAGVDTSLCQGDSVMLNATITGGTSPVVHTWHTSYGLSDSSAEDPMASPAMDTSYYFAATDKSGCISKDTVSVTVHSVPTADAGPDTSVCDGGSVQIGGTSTGATIYNWSPSASLSSSTVSNPTAAPTSDTNYELVVENSNGCSDTDSVQVIVHPLPYVDYYNVYDITCYGAFDGEIEVDAGGGTGGPYEYSIDNGFSWQSGFDPYFFSFLGPGPYDIRVRDASTQCVNSSPVSVNVNEPPPLEAEAGMNDTICPGDSVMIGGSPTASGGTSPYYYNWTPTGGLNDNTAANPKASPDSTTEYIVQVEDWNYCTDSDTMTVVVAPTPTADAGPDTSVCDGGSVQIGGTSTGASIYNWSPSASLSSSTVANPTAAPTSDTDYELVVENSNGCSDTDSVQVIVHPFPTIGNYTATDVSCNGAADGSIGIFASGGTGSAYQFSIDNGGSWSDGSNPYTFSGLGPGSYDLRVRDSSTQCVNPSPVSVTISEPAPLIVDAGVNDSVCLGDSVTIGGSPAVSGGTSPYSVTWSPTGGLSDPNAENPKASPSSFTSYTLDVVDDNGCTANDVMDLTVNPLPTADAGPDTSICEGNSITIGGSSSGADIYNWSPTGSLSDPTVEHPLASPTSTTDYELIAENFEGCSDTDSVQVIVDPAPSIASVDSMDVSCNGAADGELTINGAGGSGIYEYSIDNGFSWTYGSDPYTFSGLSPGTYDIWIRDTVSGCLSSNSETITITEPPALAVWAGPDQTICQGNSTVIGGSPTVSGGATPYSISWDNAGTLDDPSLQNPTASPSSTTTYTVSVVDNNGCAGSDMVTVTVNDLTVDAGSNQTTCQGDSVQIGGSPGVSGGTAPYTIDWTNGTSLNDSTSEQPWASPLDTTWYIMFVTDSDGCQDTSGVRVAVKDTPRVTLQPVRDTTCNGGVAEFVTAADGDNLTYTWERSTTGLGGWSPFGSNDDTLSIDPVSLSDDSTYYRLIVSNSCSQDTSDTVLLEVLEEPKVTKHPQDSSVCEGEDVLFAAAAMGAGLNYQWEQSTDGGMSWTVLTSGDTLFNSAVLASDDSTLYRVIVTDNCGNRDTSNIAVLDVDTNSVAPSGILASGDTICNGNSATLTVSGGMLGTDAQWHWYSGTCGGTVEGTGGSINVTPGTTTEYFVRAEGKCNTTVCDIQRIVPLDPPNLVQGPLEETVCATDTARFGVSFSGDSLRYQWQESTDNGGTWNNISGAISDSLKFEADTSQDGDLYRCVVSSPKCTSEVTTSVVLEVHPTPTFTYSVVDASCAGLNDGEISFQPGSTPSPYTYSIDSGNTFSSPPVNGGESFTDLDTGVYGLVMMDDNGCTSSLVIDSVDSPPALSIDAGPVPPQSCPGDSVQIGPSSGTASGGTSPYSYSWEPVAGLGDPTAPNTMAAPAQDTTYEITVTDNRGCEDSSTVFVDLFDPPAVNITGDAMLCGLDTNILDAGAGFSSYNWSTGNTTQKDSAFTYGDYWVEVTDANGCKGYDTIEVDMDSVTRAVIAPVTDTITCEDNRVSIDGSGSSAAGGNPNFFWGTSNGSIVSGGNSAVVTVSKGAKYDLAVFSPVTNCIFTDTVTVPADTVSPSVSVQGSTTITCSQDTLQLDGTASTTASGMEQYAWSALAGGHIASSDTTAGQVEVDKAGDYKLTVTDPGNSCFSTKTQAVTKSSLVPTAIASGDTIGCPPDSALLDGSLSSSVSGANAYSWKPVNGGNLIAGNNAQQAYAGAPGIYRLVVTDTVNNCSDWDTTLIHADTSSPKAVVTYMDSTVCSGDTVTLDASGSSTASGQIRYRWSTSYGAIVGDTTGPTAWVTHAGNYRFIVTDPVDMCSDTARMKVFEDCKVDIYNAFSPDGDGKNDEWIIEGVENKQNEVFIYNRWGDLIAEFADYDNKSNVWDGTNKNGRKVPEGTYFYVIKMADGSRQLTGWVQVTR